jgi:hypothetical protein
MILKPHTLRRKAFFEGIMFVKHEYVIEYVEVTSPDMPTDCKVTQE